MKDRFMINFYKDDVISSQQRFLGGRPGAERLAQKIVQTMAEKGVTVTYDIIKLN